MSPVECRGVSDIASDAFYPSNTFSVLVPANYPSDTRAGCTVSKALTAYGSHKQVPENQKLALMVLPDQTLVLLLAAVPLE